MYTHIERIYNTVARNLGLKDYSGFIDSWTEWAFEAELLIGSRDTFEEVESKYTSSGAQSSGTITFTANPSHNDSITLNGVTLFFRNESQVGGANKPNVINIKSSLADTLTELVKEIYPTSTSNTNKNAPGFYFSESLESYTYEASSTVLTITASEIGEKWNNYTLDSSDINAICSGSHLTGGKGLYKNQQLRLPDNLVKLLGVRVGTTDSSYQHLELRKPTTVHRERVGRDLNDTEQKALRYYVRGNRLNIQHDDLDEIVIVYTSYPVDAKGNPMIRNSHVTAVAQYILWQHKLIDYYNGKLGQYVAKDLEKRWYFLCGKARGDDNMPTSEELKQIGRIWNSMVPVLSNRALLDF